MHRAARPRRFRLTAVGVVAALALLSTACADRDGATDGGATEASAPSGGGDGDFGDLEGVCGPNEGGGEITSTDPAEILGVTEGTISLGSVSDPGFAGRPGLNQEVFDAAEGFVEWCNAAGGINGRQIELNLRDAAVTEYAAVITESCAEDFAVVGGGAVQDNLWASTGATCGLIDVAGFAVSSDKSGLVGRDAVESRTIQGVPNPVDQLQVGAWLTADEEHPDASERAGVLYGDIASIAEQRDRFVAALEERDHTFVYDASYAILGESNWAPFAAALREDDVRTLVFLGEPENYALLAHAMAELGYEPEVVILPANFYDPLFIESGGEDVQGAIVTMATWPFEEAANHPATQQYLDLVESIDGKPSLLGVYGISSWVLFAQAARDCDRDDDLTRTCVLETMSEVTQWTAGGLHAETNPGGNEFPACWVAVQVQGQEFVRWAPEEGYGCEDVDGQAPLVDIPG